MFFHTLFDGFILPVTSLPLLSTSHAAMSLLSSLCSRYQKPECDSAARSRVSDTEDPFQGRELAGWKYYCIYSLANNEAEIFTNKYEKIKQIHALVTVAMSVKSSAVA